MSEPAAPLPDWEQVLSAASRLRLPAGGRAGRRHRFSGPRQPPVFAGRRSRVAGFARPVRCGLG